jgi:cell surface hyaluronidase
VPREGDTVTIPAGKTFVLDTSPPRLAGLQVDGTLRFKDKNLNLHSD